MTRDSKEEVLGMSKEEFEKFIDYLEGDSVGKGDFAFIDKAFDKITRKPNQMMQRANA